MSRNTATLICFSAILLWASMVGLIKYVSTQVGAELGITLIYSVCAIVLLILLPFPNLKTIPKGYLLLAGLLFVTYEWCFSFAIGYSKTAQQAIEVSIVNYLWPSLTIVAFVLFKDLKFNFLIVIGLLMSMGGIIFIQTGSGAFGIESILQNFYSNPISYILAFIGAVVWAFYCVVTKKMSQGHNPIAIFFICVALTLWGKIFLTEPYFVMPHIELKTWFYILGTATATGLAYAAWNIGMIHGNVAVIVVASYFTPILSSVIAMFVLNASLSTTFWQGTIMVTLGSLICWISTNWLAIKPALKRLR